MSLRLPPIPAQVGNAVCSLLEQVLGQPTDIILIVFPQSADPNTEQPQPQFISSFDPDEMENIIEQLAVVLPAARSSRVVEQGGSFQ